LRWIFDEYKRASRIYPKWPYFLLVPPIATFLVMLFGYDEEEFRSVFHSAAGLQFKSDYGALAYYLLGWPMVVAVLLSIIIAALFVFLKMPKSEFEPKGEIVPTNKDLQVENHKDVFDIEEIKRELQEIEDSSLLKGFLIKFKRVCKSKYDAEILEAIIELRRKYIEGIITERKYNQEKERLILAKHSYDNVEKKKNLHDLRLQRKILKEERAIKNLNKSPKDEIEKIKKKEELRILKKHVKEEIQDRETIHNTIRNALNEIRTRKALKDEAYNWKIKIMKDDQLNENEKLALIEDIDDIVQHEIDKLQ
jgi:hypothetical protein